MANSIIGEKEIKLGDKVFKVKPTPYGIAEAENRLGGVGLSQISRRLTLGICGFQDIQAVIYGGILGATGKEKEPPLDFDQVGDLILKDGFINFLKITEELVTFWLTGKWPEELEHLKKKSFSLNSSTPANTSDLPLKN